MVWLVIVEKKRDNFYYSIERWRKRQMCFFLDLTKSNGTLDWPVLWQTRMISQRIGFSIKKPKREPASLVNIHTTKILEIQNSFRTKNESDFEKWKGNFILLSERDYWNMNYLVPPSPLANWKAQRQKLISSDHLLEQRRSLLFSHCMVPQSVQWRLCFARCHGNQPKLADSVVKRGKKKGFEP